MAGTIKRYSEEDLAKAVAACRDGAGVTRASKVYQVPERTLRRKYKQFLAGIAAMKPGPAPVPSDPAEKDIRDWVLGMQRCGYPVPREQIICKARGVYRAMYGPTRSAGSIGRDWYGRFRRRYPELTSRTAQVISHVRETVSLESAAALFGRFARVTIEYGIQADRCFNVDETAFARSEKSRRVVVVKGLRSVWAKAIEANFHLTVVACSSASGFTVPPLFILPCKRLDRDLLDACCVHGAKVTTADAGFINAHVFQEWIQHFAVSVPSPVRRSLMLVLDGVASHMSKVIDDAAARHDVILVQLPLNSSHLFQPLDAGVFKAVKAAMREAIDSLFLLSGGSTISKKDAITIASSIRNDGAERMAANAVAGFAASGIFPLSFLAMMERVCRFQSNGVKTDEPSPLWLMAKRMIREEVLALLPEADGRRKHRKPVDARRCLLSRDGLQNEP